MSINTRLCGGLAPIALLSLTPSSSPPRLSLLQVTPSPSSGATCGTRSGGVGGVMASTRWFPSASPSPSPFSSAPAWGPPGAVVLHQHLLRSSSDLGVPSAVSHSFVLPPLPAQHFLPFLKYVFSEVTLSCLRSSAVPCGGCVGTGWNCPCPACSSPSTSSQRPPHGPSCQHLAMGAQCKFRNVSGTLECGGKRVCAFMNIQYTLMYFVHICVYRNVTLSVKSSHMTLVGKLPEKRKKRCRIIS